MKYIRFIETEPEFYDKFLERIPKMQEDRKKNPDKYPKELFPPHSMSGEAKSFSIIEGTSDQVMNYIALFRPYIKIKLVPIYESDKIIEKYNKLR